MNRDVVSMPKARYMRPMNLNVPVPVYATAGAACLSPNRQAVQCREFLVQADLANSGYVSIGFSGTNLVNGLQMLPGQGWVFSISVSSLNSQIVATPANWVQGLEDAKKRIARDTKK